MVGRQHEPTRSIGEVAESLDLPQHVLRFWETRFKEIDPLKRAGGRRLYRQRDIEIVVAIRHLLYSEGYTIKGVQRILKEQGVDTVVAEVTRRMTGAAPGIGAPGIGAPAIDAPDLFDAGEDIAASDGDVNETEAEAMEPAEAEVERPPDAAPLPVAPPAVADRPSEASSPASSAPLPRPLNEDDARTLRTALAEIEECRRLLRLTIR